MATKDTPSIYTQPAERRTVARGFRIYRDQNEKLKKMYIDEASVVLRLLLDEFFQNRVPAVKIKLLKSK